MLPKLSATIRRNLTNVSWYFVSFTTNLCSFLSKRTKLPSARIAMTQATMILATTGWISRAIAGPSTADLWDIHQGAIVTGNSDALAAFPVENMFGANLGGVDYAIFGDTQLAGFVHFVEWHTLQPIRLTSFDLYANHDGESREPIRFRKSPSYPPHRPHRLAKKEIP